MTYENLHEFLKEQKNKYEIRLRNIKLLEDGQTLHYSRNRCWQYTKW